MPGCHHGLSGGKSISGYPHSVLECRVQFMSFTGQSMLYRKYIDPTTTPISLDASRTIPLPHLRWRPVHPYASEMKPLFTEVTSNFAHISLRGDVDRTRPNMASSPEGVLLSRYHSQESQKKEGEGNQFTIHHGYLVTGRVPPA